MRRRPLILLASLVLAVGCSSPAGVVGAGSVPTTTAPPATAAPPTETAPPPPAPAPAVQLAWRPCGDLECATLPVPLDHAQPGGRQIELALNRSRATDQAHRIGSLLINPGGPGSSGVDNLPFLLGLLSPKVKARFDVVGFDPRGVGRSAPVRCLPAAELDAFFAVDSTPDDPAEVTGLVRAIQHFVDGCKQRSGDLLGHVGTMDAARDMDLIRAAVGDEKLTYVGFSYGTALGTAYAELFPTRIRALLLDGAVDPALDDLALNRVQGEGFEKAFAAFSADCRAKPSCPWKPAGGPGNAALVALDARVDASPLPAGRRRVGPGEFITAVAAFLYSRTTWTPLAQALAQAEAGNGAVLLVGFDGLVGRKADGSYSNDQEANPAINCLDRPAPRDVAVYARAAAEAARTAPAFGPATAWFGLLCGLWPVPATGTVGPAHAPGSPPILVVGTTNDPATPFVWSEALAKQLPQGRLLRHEGEGHTAFGDDPCTTRIGDDYLLNLRLSAGPLRC